MGPYFVGALIGEVVTWVIVSRQISRPGAVTGKAVSGTERQVIYSTVAFIWVLWGLVLVLVASAFMEVGYLVTAAINLAVAAVILYRTGLPRSHPLWQRFASVWRG